MPNRLANPVTRQRMSYIGWFFILDTAICFAAFFTLKDATVMIVDTAAVILFGLLGAGILSMLYVTREKAPQPLRGSRSRE